MSGRGFLSLTFAFPILFTYALSLTLRLEKPQAAKALGVLTGLAGGLILALSKVGLGTSPTLWIVLAMTSPVIIAGGNIYRTLRWPAGVSPIFLAAAMLLCGGALLIPFALIQAPGGYAGLLSDRALFAVLLLQIAIFSVLYVFYFVLQRLAGPVYLSQIGTVAAVVGTVVAVWLLGEAVPPNLTVVADACRWRHGAVSCAWQRGLTRGYPDKGLPAVSFRPMVVSRETAAAAIR